MARLKRTMGRKSSFGWVTGQRCDHAPNACDAKHTHGATADGVINAPPSATTMQMTCIVW